MCALQLAAKEGEACSVYITTIRQTLLPSLRPWSQHNAPPPSPAPSQISSPKSGNVPPMGSQLLSISRGRACVKDGQNTKTIQRRHMTRTNTRHKQLSAKLPTHRACFIITGMPAACMAGRTEDPPNKNIQLAQRAIKELAAEQKISAPPPPIPPLLTHVKQ